MIVAGDFNARIGDVKLVDPEDEFLSFLPQANADRVTNENRASFLSFLEAADLRILNGHHLNPQGHPVPAGFTFTSVRSRQPPAPPSTCVIARSCIDFILLPPSLIDIVQPIHLSTYHHSEHVTLSTKIPFLTALEPEPPATPILKFQPPAIDTVLEIFRKFDLSRIPPDAHPLTYLTEQIHAQGKWKPRAEAKSWFDTPETTVHQTRVSRLRSEARKFHRALVDRGDLSSFPDFIQARTQWIAAVDEGRRLATTTFQTRLAAWKKDPHLPGNSSKLWKIMSGKKSEFGTSIPEDQLIAHFNALLFKSQPLTYTPSSPTISDPFLDSPFSEAEVKHAIKSKNSSSAPGVDQLQYSFWKAVADDPESLTCLTSVFNLVFTSGKVPDDWHTAIVAMLYKGKGPRNLPTNFRAISLTSTSLKIFETLLASRISAWAEINKLLSFHQAGFRRHLSTYDHVFTLASLQKQAGKNNIFVGFIDLAKAFPSVSRSKLLSKLQSLGLSSQMLNVIAEMYTPDSYRFILSKASLGSMSGQADTGTREGSCLSPLLFILFVSDLPAFLDVCKSLGPKIGSRVIRVLQFADDTTLIAQGRVEFQKLLNRFALYCEENDLKINASKTEIINLRHGSRASRKDRWVLNDAPLRLSKGARYLGVIFSTGRMGIHHTKHLRARNLAKVWSLASRIRRAGFTDSRFIFRLFRVLIVSSATYGASLLLPFPKHHLTKNLDCLLTGFLRSIWSLPRGTPNHLVLSAANSPCMSCLCLEDGVLYLLRKLRNWGINSPLVESVITDMFERRGSPEDPPSGSAEDPLSRSWLEHMIRYLVDDLHLPISQSSLPNLRASVLALDRADLHQRITHHCHRSCYPPSPARSAMYQSLSISSSHTWPCFESAAPHFRLCRFFISDSFCHSRLLFSNGISRECELCGISLSIDHWLHCPLRANDRALLTRETGFNIDSMERIRDVYTNARFSVAMEFVLSKFFTWT